ncbi:hypothetical protein [Paenibacillus glacialis]|uniref:Uncharacterized protein n=1 Tax=Paenibacillus glacialis TaxID=494026 RepID=A0A168LDP6_9BACL|nr:hypothetical protein [Paenibacillus glacialis]OAB43245.1 hypothetical protein PGLA_09635 [Paenibacillus glacialis]
MRKRTKFKHFMFMLIALGMLIYAIPSISFNNGNGWVSLFSVVWVAFSLLVIAAHWHVILGVDEEKKKALERVRLLKLQQWQLTLSEESERSNGM